VCVEVRRICCLHREAASAHELSTAWPPYSADAEHAEADAADIARSRRMRAHADVWRAAADAYAALLLRIERLVRAHIQLPFRYVSGYIHTYSCHFGIYECHFGIYISINGLVRAHIQLPFRYVSGSVYTHTYSCHFGIYMYTCHFGIYIYINGLVRAHIQLLQLCCSCCSSVAAAMYVYIAGYWLLLQL
jgi:hypothetical protein